METSSKPSSSRRDFLQLASAAVLTAGATQGCTALGPGGAGPSGEIWRWDAADVAAAIRNGRILSLPGLSVPTGTVEGVPMGVQLVAGAFREDLCLAAGEVIERSFPMPTPIDPHAA